MPTIARWANDLRTVFGTDDINDAMRRHGYMASEGGRTIDTRSPRQPQHAFTPATPVVSTPHPTVAGRIGARR